MNQRNQALTGRVERAVRRTVEAVRRFLVQNTLLKVISLGLALLIWYSVSSQQEHRDVTLSSVPLQVTNTSRDVLVTALATRVVDMRVRGPATVVSDLQPSDLSISVDVTKLAPGHHTLMLDAGLVNRPAGLEVLRIDPPSIPITLERLITRAVPVVATFDESGLASSYAVVGSKIEPGSVEVTGPQSVVEELKQLTTKAISLGAADSEMVFTEPLDVSQVGPVSITPTQVKVTALIEELGHRQFAHVPVRRPRRVIVSAPSSVDVIIAGPRSAINQVEARDVAVTVNADGLPSGSHEVTPVVQISKDVAGQLRSIRTEPEKISIQVR
jgi:YbbR domain-containing protein